MRLRLENYLDEIGVNYTEEDMSVWEAEAYLSYDSPNGATLTSSSEQFNNLVGKYLINKYNTEPSWGIPSYLKGNLCSPTTFNRIDKAIEFVYGKDYLGKLSNANSIYRSWQNQKGALPPLYGTGIIPDMGLGTTVDEEQIKNGELKPGALIRLTQIPGPRGSAISWHAAIFIKYIKDENGNNKGILYWHHWTRTGGQLKNKYSAPSIWDFNNKGIYIWYGYKPILGVNFN